jgi:hypothetical protein
MTIQISLPPLKDKKIYVTHSKGMYQIIIIDYTNINKIEEKYYTSECAIMVAEALAPLINADYAGRL